MIHLAVLSTFCDIGHYNSPTCRFSLDHTSPSISELDRVCDRALLAPAPAPAPHVAAAGAIAAELVGIARGRTLGAEGPQQYRAPQVLSAASSPWHSVIARGISSVCCSAITRHPNARRS